MLKQRLNSVFDTLIIAISAPESCDFASIDVDVDVGVDVADSDCLKHNRIVNPRHQFKPSAIFYGKVLDTLTNWRFRGCVPLKERMLLKFGGVSNHSDQPLESAPFLHCGGNVHNGVEKGVEHYRNHHDNENQRSRVVDIAVIELIERADDTPTPQNGIKGVQRKHL